MSTMATLKYDIPLLDRNITFTLWQVKMRAGLAQLDLSDALLGIDDKMPSSLSLEEKQRKDKKPLLRKDKKPLLKSIFIRPIRFCETF